MLKGRRCISDAPAIPLLGIHSRGMLTRVPQEVGAEMFTAALSVTTKHEK